MPAVRRRCMSRRCATAGGRHHADVLHIHAVTQARRFPRRHRYSDDARCPRITAFRPPSLPYARGDFPRPRGGRQRSPACVIPVHRRQHAVPFHRSADEPPPPAARPSFRRSSQQRDGDINPTASLSQRRRDRCCRVRHTHRTLYAPPPSVITRRSAAWQRTRQSVQRLRTRRVSDQCAVHAGVTRQAGRQQPLIPPTALPCQRQIASTGAMPPAPPQFPQRRRLPEAARQHVASRQMPQ